MDNREQRFEDFLREFEPRRPRALPQLARPMRLWRHLALGMAAAGLAGVLWWGLRAPGPNPIPLQFQVESQIFAGSNRPSIVELTRLAIENPAEFDAVLTAESRGLLPGFNSEDSMLRVLAKE